MPSYKWHKWQDANPGLDVEAPDTRQTLTHCAGPCEQGRKLCPCPEACETPDKDSLNTSACVLVWIVGTLALWAAIISFALALRQ